MAADPRRMEVDLQRLIHALESAISAKQAKSTEGRERLRSVRGGVVLFFYRQFFLFYFLTSPLHSGVFFFAALPKCFEFPHSWSGR
jgi:hypothetical protein